MMALIRDRALVDDQFSYVLADEQIPDRGPVIVTLTHLQGQFDALVGRDDPVGVRLKSDEHPETIVDFLQHLDVIALEFPTFRDGRPYSYARLIRDRYGFSGELRAVGDVLLEQLHYMERVGFNAFELDSDDPEQAIRIAAGDFSVWYQPSGDDRPNAAQLRQKKERSD
jgi:uncharacterized protein (DUF934 family)